MSQEPTTNASTGPISELPPEARVLRWLPRAAILSVLACLALMVLLKVQHELGRQHFVAIPFVALAFFMFVATGVAVLLALTNPFRWRLTGVSPWWVLVALLPVALWGTVGVYGFGNWGCRYVPNNALMNLAKRAGASLMESELALGWSYPHRIAGERVTMFHRGVSHPGDDVALMDAYLAELETMVGQPLRGPIHWVRGSLIGDMLSGLSVYGLALGSSESRMDPASAFPGEKRLLDGLDRHEAAHAVMSALLPPDADPPTILNEGWAMVHQNGWLGPGPVDETLIRQDFRGLQENAPENLPALFGPDWYHQDSGPVYAYGTHLVRSLIARHGVERFLELMSTIRPDTVESTFQRLYGTDLATIERVMIAESAQAPTSSSPVPEDLP